MIAGISSDVGESLSIQLATALWAWRVSQDCIEQRGVQCDDEVCPCGRVPQLQRYLQYYKAVISTYMDTTSPTKRRVKEHTDLCAIVSIIKSHPDATLSELCQLTSPETKTQDIHGANQADAVALVVKAMLMIDPSALHHSSDRLEKGTFRVHWKEDVPLSKYIQDSFPLGNHNVLSYNNSELFADVKRQLKATNMKRRLGITIRATSDIRNHLLFDRRNNILEVYHYTSFLKEQLRVTRDIGDCSSPSLSLKR